MKEKEWIKQVGKMRQGIGKEGPGLRIVTILNLVPTDVGYGVKTHHKVGGEMKGLLCVIFILEPVLVRFSCGETGLGRLIEPCFCCDIGQIDIFSRIELNPSFVLSSDNTNCKNDIQ